jgi:hypothetical protein
MGRSVMRRFGVQVARALWIGMCCLVASGCMGPGVYTPIWNYLVETYPPTTQPLTQKRLVVPPFQDSRPRTGNLDNTEATIMPVVPFGWLDYPRPERGPYFMYYLLMGSRGENTSYRSFKPMEDLARASAEELRASGLFQEVVVAPRAAQGDLILKGEVKSTRYYATVISYGLSGAAFIPWMIGLPSGKFTNELRVEFSLEDSDTHTVLWRKAYTDVYEATHWFFYYHPDQFKYAALFKTMMRDVVHNLRQELTSHP